MIAILILKSTNQKFSSLDNPTLEGYTTQGGLEERLECFNSFFFRSWSPRVENNQRFRFQGAFEARLWERVHEGGLIRTDNWEKTSGVSKIDKQAEKSLRSRLNLLVLIMFFQYGSLQQNIKETKYQNTIGISAFFGNKFCIWLIFLLNS